MYFVISPSKTLLISFISFLFVIQLILKKGFMCITLLNSDFIWSCNICSQCATLQKKGWKTKQSTTGCKFKMYWKLLKWYYIICMKKWFYVSSSNVTIVNKCKTTSQWIRFPSYFMILLTWPLYFERKLKSTFHALN